LREIRDLGLPDRRFPAAEIAEPAYKRFITEDENGVPVNQYFLERPEMILGTMVFDDGMYGNRQETACKPFPDAPDLSEQLAEALLKIDLPDLSIEYDKINNKTMDEKSIPADPGVRNYSYAMANGKIYFRENSLMRPVAGLNRTSEEQWTDFTWMKRIASKIYKLFPK
jgi:hypothetical protein